jgi:hypothetical protein
MFVISWISNPKLDILAVRGRGQQFFSQCDLRPKNADSVWTGDTLGPSHREPAYLPSKMKLLQDDREHGQSPASGREGVAYHIPARRIRDARQIQHLDAGSSMRVQGYFQMVSCE